ncbi:uncharacterized protein HMPREF1541_03658 [Cyphellophora europaea CBS 101466]|uniref:DUF7598 domain-containing protein n=1 Tax=Cyphellophora europaea (strain CBS 101466) TaxID=1220924 RepID=W2RZ38_CYPE1|nr:uncharacterized protein HMPREF1541_03658 [Cyphellophora europaea CBS 101466]ETN41722.1 hypothetical protein HMPREF1541_03658 [Cyphellophora europaea CBS 101466]
MRFFGNVAGAGYVVLNGIRALNIVALLTVIAASGSLLVKTFDIDGFGFFAALSHSIRILIALFLIVSELPILKNYYIKNWPLFSPRHGFVMLGFTFLFLGVNIFGELSHREASQKRLTMPFWQLCLAAGILMIVMSVINIIASYIFRDGKNNITARQVRAHGAAASKHAVDVVSVQSPSPNRATRYRSFFLRNKQEKRTSLPSYESTPHRGMNISSPISPASSKYSGYTRGPVSPEAAKHPAERHGNMI